MGELVSNLEDSRGRELVKTVVGDLQSYVIGRESEFFATVVNSALHDRLAAATKEFYRVIYLGYQVWDDLDQHFQQLLVNLATECHSVLVLSETTDNGDRFSQKFLDSLAGRFERVKVEAYQPIIQVIGSIRYVKTAGLYDEDPLTTQQRLDNLFADFRQKTSVHTLEQISKLRVALQEVVSDNITTKTVTELNRALCWMRVKALLTAVLSAVIAWCTISFVLGSQDSNLESTYHVAASIARRLTVVTISLFAVGLFVRLLRSYISTIEGMQHKRRLLESSGELLVMGGAENSQYVFTQLIAILMKNDFAMTSGDKTDSHEASVIANVLSNLQKSESKT